MGTFVNSVNDFVVGFLSAAPLRWTSPLLGPASPELPASVSTVASTDFYNRGPLVLAGCLLWQDPFDKDLFSNSLCLQLQGIHINFSECSLRILGYVCLELEYGPSLPLLPQGNDSQTCYLQKKSSSLILASMGRLLLSKFSLANITYGLHTLTKTEKGKGMS